MAKTTIKPRKKSRTKSSKSKSVADPLKKVFEERIVEFTNPKKREELWERSRLGLAKVLEGGANILDGVLDSFRSNGLSAADGAYRTLQDAQSDYMKLRQALLRQRISAVRFDKAWLQVQETVKTRLATIEQKEIRKIAVDLEKAVGDGVNMVLKLVREVFGIG